MRLARKYTIPAFAAVFALMFALATPYVMAEYSHGYATHDGTMYKKHLVQVEGFEGTIPITEDSDKAALKASAIPLSEAAANYPDVKKAKLGIAGNENGDKFLVWKLVDFIKDSESETTTMKIYIVDAGDADNTAEITKEFDHSMKYTEDGDHKWSHYKMKEHFGDLTPEEQAEKMEQFKEMKEAFASLSEEDHVTIMSHFKDMKGQYADLTEEEKTAKHDELKQQMEAFMGLSLDEKISYLKYLAMSLRN